MRQDGRGSHKSRPKRRAQDNPGRPREDMEPLDGGDQRLVHLASTVVGPPHTGIQGQRA